MFQGDTQDAYLVSKNIMATCKIESMIQVRARNMCYSKIKIFKFEKTSKMLFDFK